eukprot:4623283-Prymnesium_polylepis.1
MELEVRDEQPASAEPRATAAAAPLGTAVGGAVGVGGTPTAGDEGWTTVLSRRARQQGRARLDGTASGATRRATAARAADTRRTAAVIEYYGKAWGV